MFETFDIAWNGVLDPSVHVGRVYRIGRAQEVVHSVSLGQMQGHSPCFEFCADTYRPRLPRPSARPPARPSVRPSVRVRPGPSGSVRVRPVRPVRPGPSGWVDDANHICNT